MADIEVENVLREIRERVRAEAAERAPLVARAETAHDHGDTGDPGDEGRAAGGPASGALARMEANLATTERAWNRLPPLVSNRAGWVARLELWVKRKIKRALHWFTWEQVNFNSAVHHALRDAAAALADYERRLGDHDRRLAAARAEASALRAEVEASRAEAEAARAELASLRRADDELRSLLESEKAGAAARLAEVERRAAAAGERLETEVTRFNDALAAAVEQLREEERSLADSLIQLRDEQRALAEGAGAERREQVAGLRRELDERAEHLREELRVSFRQLSLEASEAAVTHDRARRHLEARLEALEKELLRAED